MRLTQQNSNSLFKCQIPFVPFYREFLSMILSPIAPAKLFHLPCAETPVKEELGERVAMLVNQPSASGSHTVVWNTEKFGPAIYCIRIPAGRVERIKKCANPFCGDFSSAKLSKLK